MMFDALPDLTPRDSHMLWYTSLRNPHLHPTHHPDQPDLNPSQHAQTSAHGSNNNNNNQNRHSSGLVPLELTSLGRLRADEAYLSRRLANVSNFGHTWLKPPGVPKSLYQMREERREAEEQAEAMRREQLAAELAEAEAAQAAQGMEGMMMDGEGEGEEEEVDLDDEIPDADGSGMGGFGYEDSDEEEEESSEEEEEEEVEVPGQIGEEEDDDDDDVNRLTPRQRRAQHRELVTHEDRLRELLARGGDDVDEADMYGGAGEELDDEEVEGEMLEEEDLVHEDGQPHLQYEVEPGEDLDMDANLDDDIPEAESLGGYEHTDSDAELSSSSEEEDDNSRNVSFGAGPGGGHRASQARLNNRSSLASNATRQSLDISSILASSTMGSSPQVRRRN